MTQRNAMEGLMREYNVAAVIAGHVHAYERTKPVYDDTVDTKCGTTYVRDPQPPPSTPSAALHMYVTLTFTRNPQPPPSASASASP